MAFDSMMQFRLSYLQLVSWAWEDDERYAAIVGEVNGYKYFDQLSLTLPTWNIKLKISDPTTKLAESGYAPAATGGWIGPRARLTIQFPEQPGDAAIPSASAAYYALLPNPFGEAPPPDAGGASSGAGGHGMGHMSDAFVLGGVILRALTISWKDPIFRAQLVSGQPINGLLMDYIGYNLPWNMDLFGEVGTSVFTAAGQDDDLGNWGPVPRNTLEMFMPKKPLGNGADRALALAAYNQTGDQYPLTCP
ncbi:MAG TPA: BMA_0021/BMA_0022 family TOMM bacteriocin [Polyangiaceae bacterium]|nr:BMA_0021/BMA_0022 family TOMM bacteriocin [Polyangiaceae bacterium]